MSNKEAIAIVLDVGPSMNQAPPGESSALQTSLAAINMILQRKMFAESKDEVALVLFGTSDTANELAEDDSYQNITVAQPLGLVDWSLMQYIENDVQPSTVSGDFLDALVVAMDHLVKGIQGKRGFGSKRIILFTDVGGEFGDDQLDDIVGGMKEAQIEFNVIGPQLDADEDDDDGDGKGGPRPGTSNGHVKERTPQQNAGCALLEHILQAVDGESYSFSEALPALSFFQSRQVKPTAWKCQMEIGTELKIPINLYAKIKEAKAKSYKNVYAKDPDAEIERARTYHLNDEEETEIEKSDIVEGHRYGSTLVPFSEEDKDAMKYKTNKCFKILGFTKEQNLKRHHRLGDTTSVVVAEKTDEAAAVALSAIINALYETNSIAIVRRCYANNSPVKMGCLVPHIKSGYECLIYNEIPFTEDLRQFTFGSLPVKEDSAINNKFAPSDEQLKLVDELIDQMDLESGVKDEDGDSQEALKPKLTFNPHLQRLYQCLQHRALNPDDPLPELSPIVANYLKPPRAIQTKCEPIIDKLKQKFKLVEVEKKKDDQVAGNIFKDGDAPGAGDAEPAAKKAKMDDDLGGGMADLVKAKVTEVGTVTPVEDFKAIVGDKEEDRFEAACKMMEKRITQLVMDSFGSQFYGKAMDCLKAFREAAVKNSEPQTFNDFLKSFKVTLKDKDRTDFWDEIVTEKLSLITKMESEDGGVSKGESDKFLQKEEEEKKEEPPKEEAADAEDLFAQL